MRELALLYGDEWVWDDDPRGTAILEKCRDVMAPGARLLIIERLDRAGARAYSNQSDINRDGRPS